MQPEKNMELDLEDGEIMEGSTGRRHHNSRPRDRERAPRDQSHNSNTRSVHENDRRHERNERRRSRGRDRQRDRPSSTTRYEHSRNRSISHSSRSHNSRRIPYRRTSQNYESAYTSRTRPHERARSPPPPKRNLERLATTTHSGTSRRPRARPQTEVHPGPSSASRHVNGDYWASSPSAPRSKPPDVDLSNNNYQHQGNSRSIGDFGFDSDGDDSSVIIVPAPIKPPPEVIVLDSSDSEDEKQPDELPEDEDAILELELRKNVLEQLLQKEKETPASGTNDANYDSMCMSMSSDDDGSRDLIPSPPVPMRRPDNVPSFTTSAASHSSTQNEPPVNPQFRPDYFPSIPPHAQDASHMYVRREDLDKLSNQQVLNPCFATIPERLTSLNCPDTTPLQTDFSLRPRPNLVFQPPPADQQQPPAIPLKNLEGVMFTRRANNPFTAYRYSAIPSPEPFQRRFQFSNAVDPIPNLNLSFGQDRMKSNPQPQSIRDMEQRTRQYSEVEAKGAEYPNVDMDLRFGVPPSKPLGFSLDVDMREQGFQPIPSPFTRLPLATRLDIDTDIEMAVPTDLSLPKPPIDNPVTVQIVQTLPPKQTEPTLPPSSTVSSVAPSSTISPVIKSPGSDLSAASSWSCAPWEMNNSSQDDEAASDEEELRAKLLLEVAKKRLLSGSSEGRTESNIQPLSAPQAHLPTTLPSPVSNAANPRSTIEQETSKLQIAESASFIGQPIRNLVKPTPTSVPIAPKASPGTTAPTARRTSAGGAAQITPKTSAAGAVLTVRRTLAPKTSATGAVPTVRRSSTAGTAPIAPNTSVGGAVPLAPKTFAAGVAPMTQKSSPVVTVPIARKTSRPSTAPRMRKTSTADTAPITPKTSRPNTAPRMPRTSTPNASRATLTPKTPNSTQSSISPAHSNPILATPENVYVTPKSTQTTPSIAQMWSSSRTTRKETQTQSTPPHAPISRSAPPAAPPARSALPTQPRTSEHVPQVVRYVDNDMFHYPPPEFGLPFHRVVYNRNAVPQPPAPIIQRTVINHAALANRHRVFRANGSSPRGNYRKPMSPFIINIGAHSSSDEDNENERSDAPEPPPVAPVQTQRRLSVKSRLGPIPTPATKINETETETDSSEFVIPPEVSLSIRQFAKSTCEWVMKRKLNAEQEEAESQRKAEEESRRRAAESQKKLEEENQRRAVETQKKAEEESRRRAVESQKKAEEEKQRRAAESQKKAEEESRRRAVESQKKAEEEKQHRAAEIQKKAEEENQRQEAESRKKAEEEERQHREAESERKVGEEKIRRRAAERKSVLLAKRRRVAAFAAKKGFRPTAVPKSSPFKRKMSASSGKAAEHTATAAKKKKVPEAASSMEETIDKETSESAVTAETLEKSAVEKEQVEVVDLQKQTQAEAEVGDLQNQRQAEAEVDDLQNQRRGEGVIVERIGQALGTNEGKENIIKNEITASMTPADDKPLPHPTVIVYPRRLSTEKPLLPVEPKQEPLNVPGIEKPATSPAQNVRSSSTPPSGKRPLGGSRRIMVPNAIKHFSRNRQLEYAVLKTRLLNHESQKEAQGRAETLEGVRTEGSPTRGGLIKQSASTEVSPSRSVTSTGSHSKCESEPGTARGIRSSNSSAMDSGFRSGSSIPDTRTETRAQSGQNISPPKQKAAVIKKTIQSAIKKLKVMGETTSESEINMAVQMIRASATPPPSASSADFLQIGPVYEHEPANENVSENGVGACALNLNSTGATVDESPRNEFVLRQRLLKAKLVRHIENSNHQINLKSSENTLIAARTEALTHLDSWLEKRTQLIRKQDQREKLGKQLIRLRNETMRHERIIMGVDRSVERLREELGSEVGEALDLAKKCDDLAETCVDYGRKRNDRNYAPPARHAEELKRKLKVCKIHHEALIRNVQPLDCLDRGVTKSYDQADSSSDEEELFIGARQFADVLRVPESKNMTQNYDSPLLTIVDCAQGSGEFPTKLNPKLALCNDELICSACQVKSCCFQHLKDVQIN